MEKPRALKGFKDLLPGESERWEAVYSVMRESFEAFGFSLISTPILERTNLFTRSIGETSDIVEKEMYTFEDWDKKPVTLRPEGTASVVRAYLEKGLAIPTLPTKLYYQGPMFRHERPQAGRLRQFHQIGAEIIGTLDPHQDVELLSLLHNFFQRLEITSLTLEINSLGCPACRPAYREVLQGYLKKQLTTLCEDCQRRYLSNPLRILDCKKTDCKTIAKEAPVSSAHLCEICDTHFTQVQNGLKLLKIPYEVNTLLVRGLDYYTKTAFEMTTRNLGAQNAVAAGGRYDGLVAALGGPPTPAIGFAMGMERIVALLDGSNDYKAHLKLFIAPLGKAAHRQLFPLLYQIRQKNIRSEIGQPEAGLKRQMKQADRLGARFVLIVGDNELAEGKVILRNMATKAQLEMPLEHLLDGLLDQINAPA